MNSEAETNKKVYPFFISGSSHLCSRETESHLPEFHHNHHHCRSITMMKMLTALIVFAFLHAFYASASPLLPTLPQYGSLAEMYKGLAQAKPQQYLNAHNEVRQKFGVPPLQWDPKLEAYSRTYANLRSKICRLQHSYGPYGENIAWELYEEVPPAQVIKKFIDEQMHYDLKTGVCHCPPLSATCMCGHFTQVIWKTTKRVGCAEATCSGEKGKLVVCSYDPRGNAPNQNPLQPLK